MDVKGIDKARILCALYNYSPAAPAALMYGTAGPNTLSLEKAKEIIARRGNNLYFDYLDGHMIKTDIGRDVLDLYLYDRDNGRGAGERAILEELTDPQK